MCRMLGLVAAQPVSPRSLLRDAPRSLANLSREHRDGWGVASWTDGAWKVDKGTSCAAACTRYAEVAESAPANLLIAHVRKKTVGETTLANTHPFQRSIADCDVVFAHNGTVQDVSVLMEGVSRARAAELTGNTDSERLFAYIATAIDDADDIEAGIRTAVRRLHALHHAGGIGSITFLLSCGQRLYAHRLGRTLHILARGEHPAAVVVASEQLTDEPWQEVIERSLVMVECGPSGEPKVSQLI